MKISGHDNIDAALALSRPVGIHVTGSSGYQERAGEAGKCKKLDPEDETVSKVIERVAEMMK